VKKRYRAHFRRVIVLQVTFLALTALLLAWSILETTHLAVPLIVALIVVLQVLGLLRFVEGHIETLEDFFAAVNFEDFTRRYVEEDVDAELKGAFNSVLERFQEARAERDVQAGYLEMVVRHVPVPFIAARADGKLTLVNNPARRLTGLSALSHIDQLAKLDPELPNRMRELDAGSQQLLQSKLKGVPAELRISVSEIRLDGGVERLYSIENLSGELAARESSAWRNLIRVLTHEIMNTLTPVTSLAQTTTGLLDDESAKEDIREAVQTIERRSEGLMNFVLRYRELLQIPKPEPKPIRVKSALESVAVLMKAELGAIDIKSAVSPETLEVNADLALLDQVLVNLVKNSIQAMSATPKPVLELSGRLEFGRALITVRDNGPGMDDETLREIFVPFFTTKRDGSGIGLSLCRQIMSAHGGDIVVTSDTGGTSATLIF